jgi:putative PIN family toxin of toxin-antitoxin system
LRVVLDTNVLISGSFYSGPPKRILKALIEGKFQMALSPEILSEYRRVGENFSPEHPNPDFERMLSLLVTQALIVDAPELEKPLCRDPHDDKFIACALAVGAEVIVSGDNDLLSLSDRLPITVMSPNEFIDEYL